jgi:uncharacterized iron-regulated protein
MKIILMVIFFIGSFAVNAQDLTAFQLFTKKGKKVKYAKMIKALEQKSVVLFGELHNNPIAHWMQLKLTQDLYNKKKNIALGAEMFEADNHNELNAYLNGEIDQKAFDTLARLWSNYRTDYKPLVDLAKEQKLPFIATNVPRRYASLVYKNGFEALEELKENERPWVAPHPIPYDPDLPGYKKMLTMMSDHANENFPKAQAIKDATMGYFIMQHLINNPRDLFIHYNGAYHSNNYEGIYWYLETYAKQFDFEGLTIGTITTVLQSDLSKLDEENLNLADYILVVDEEMTTTY